MGGWLADRGITGELTLIVGSGFGSDGGREGLDSPMLVEGFLRAVVVSVGNAPADSTDGVVHLGGGPDVHQCSSCQSYFTGGSFVVVSWPLTAPVITAHSSILSL